MSSEQVRTLNDGQIEVLMTLYKFRFGTRDLLASSLGIKNGTALYSRLSILMKYGLVAMRFEPSYKLAGRPAEYYVSPAGLRLLLERIKPEGLDDKTIKASYKDKTASKQFIDHSLNIFEVANTFASLYKTLKLFTKRELAAYDYFPTPLPDAFLSIKGKETERFFMELIEAHTPPFAVDRRLRQLLTYYENDDWSVTTLPFPTLLFICENGATERRFKKQLARAINRNDTYIEVRTTSLGALLASTPEDMNIWSNVTDDTLLNL